MSQVTVMVLLVLSLLPHCSHCGYHDNIHNFTHFLQHSSQYVTSDRTLVFQPGVYNITSNASFVIHSVSNLTLNGSAVEVICFGGASFTFYNVTGLRIQNFTIRNCGSLAFVNISTLRILNSTFISCGQQSHRNATVFNKKGAVIIENSRDVIIRRVSIRNSTGYGLLGRNLLGEATVSNSAFAFNAPGHCEVRSQCAGGNALFLYDDSNDAECLYHAETHHLSINNSIFLHGIDQSEQATHIGSGLGIAIASTTFRVSVRIEDISLVNNSADIGANLYLALQDCICGCTITIANVISIHGNSLKGSGLYYSYTTGVPQRCDICLYHHTAIQLIIVNTTITNHIHGSAVHMDFPPTLGFRNYYSHHIVINRTAIYNSSGLLKISGPTLPCNYPLAPQRSHSPLWIEVQNSLFIHNQPQYDISTRTPASEQSAIELESVRSILFTNCSITDNRGTGLLAFDSTIEFNGIVVFHNNTGEYGGGTALYNSFVFLNSSRVIFSNNHAERRGGGVYVESCRASHLRAEQCFLQSVGNDSIGNSQVVFVNNTAGEAGDMIYGGQIDSCNGSFTLTQTNSHESLSPISSDPQGICLCLSGVPRCNIREWHANETYPGQTVQIPAVTVGQRDGVVPGKIRADFVPHDGGLSTTATLQKGQQVQATGSKCTNLSFTVVSHNTYEDMVLRLEGSQSTTRSPEESILIHWTILPTPSTILPTPSTIQPTPSTIQSMPLTVEPMPLTVEPIPCPRGFELSEESTCVCSEVFQRHDISCDLNNNSFTTEGNTWVGMVNDKLAIHTDCPFDYCKSGVAWTFDDLDKQCDYNRLGTLCGSCKEGESLVLGSSHCQKCSNRYVGLLALFIAAGPIGLLLLSVMNLTVTTGTISGLIFYANIVQVNYSAFFPAESPNPFIKQILTFFIAWPNLDLGYEVCFYNGITAQAKIWLHYVFPAYLISLAGLLLFISKCTTVTVEKHLGKLSLSVFATVLLLCYAKVLRIIITTTASVTTLHYVEGGSTKVWLIDGSIPYMNSEIIPLFIAAIVAFLIFILPMTLLLLLAPCLLAATNHTTLKCLKSKNLESLLETYVGPFRKKATYWPGLLLTLRIILFTTAMVFSTPGRQETSLLIVTTIIVCLLTLTWQIGRVYNSLLVNVAESSFILNLGVVSTWSLFQRNGIHASPHQYIITYVMLGVAFAITCIILGYHGTHRVMKLVANCNRHHAPLQLEERYVPVQSGASCTTISMVSLQESEPEYTEVEHSHPLQLRREVHGSN